MIAGRRPEFWFLRCGLIFVFLAALVMATGGPVYSSPAASAVGAPNLAAVVTVTPTTAVPNQQISLFGTGFTPATTSGGNGPGGAHQITGVGISGVTVSGVLLASPNVTYPINLDSNGNWFVSVVVPVNATSLLGGTQEVTVIDDNGVVVVSSYTLPLRTFSVSPSTSRRNSAVTVTGAGYHATNGLAASTYTISIEYGQTIVGNFTADANGDLTAIIMVPLTATIPSSNSIRTTILGTGQTNSTTHTVPGAAITVTPATGPPGTVATVSGTDFPAFTHTVPGAAITVTPATGPPGTVATVSGTDFPAFVTVSAINAGAVSVMQLPGSNTNSQGEFISTITIPNFPAGWRPPEGPTPSPVLW